MPKELGLEPDEKLLKGLSKISEDVAATGKKTGRPRKTFDAALVRSLSRLGLTHEEMGSVLGCSHDTVALRCNDDEDFSVAYKMGRAELKASLRTQQISKALKGNTAMLIWLGKQLLGQRDKAQVEHRDYVPLEMPAKLPREQFSDLVDKMTEAGTLPGAYMDPEDSDSLPS